MIHFGRFVAWKRLALGLSREEFGQRAGVTARRMAAIEAQAEPGVFDSTFGGIARALRMQPEDLAEAWRREPVSVKFPRKAKGKRVGSDETAAARLLSGEPVMLEDLKAAALARGVGLGELFRTISREWLAEHRAPRVAHTGLEGLRPPSPSDPPSRPSARPHGKPAQARQGGRSAGRKG